MSKIEIISKSAKETQKIAQILAGELAGRRKNGVTIIALEGQLGSGKTTFAQGFARALRVKENVLSPTFVLLKAYPVREKRRMFLQNKSNFLHKKSMQKFQPMFLSNGVYLLKKPKRFKHFIHIDCYRINRPREMEHLGLKEIFKDKDAIVLIEWADRIKKLLPKETLWIKFKHGKKSHERILHI